MLGVSRTPLREALTRLRLEGLIDATPGGGHAVAAMHPAAVRELFLIREVLEVLAVTEFVRVDAPIEPVRTLFEEQRATTNRDDFLRADLAMHTSIPRLAGLNQVAEQLVSIHVRTTWLRLRTKETKGWRERALKQHRGDIRGLERRDADAAATAVRAHLATTRTVFDGYESERLQT